MSSKTAVKRLKAAEAADRRRKSANQRKLVDQEKTQRSELIAEINKAKIKKIEQLDRDGWPEGELVWWRIVGRRRLMSKFGAHYTNNPCGEHWLYIDPKGHVYAQWMIDVDGMMMTNGDHKRWKLRKLPIGALKSILRDLS